MTYKAKDYHYLYNQKTWKELRKRHLSNNPICIYCKTHQKIVVATVVDHIKPHKGNVDLFHDPDNLQSLCKRCHDGAKKKEENRSISIGCDKNGIPIDSNHHWNKKGGAG